MQKYKKHIEFKERGQQSLIFFDNFQRNCVQGNTSEKKNIFLESFQKTFDETKTILLKRFQKRNIIFSVTEKSVQNLLDARQRERIWIHLNFSQKRT